MTDGQTDGQTELRWLRRAVAVPAVARNNNTRVIQRPGVPRYRGIKDKSELTWNGVLWFVLY